MKKIIGAAALAAMAFGALASDATNLPYISNGNGARDVSGIAAKAESMLSGLSSDETVKLDQVTSSAAARAVIALKCEGEGFSRVSKRIEMMMEAKVILATQNPIAAKAYARDSALMKYKAMAIANNDLPCQSLGQLADIARIEGFMD